MECFGEEGGGDSYLGFLPSQLSDDVGVKLRFTQPLFAGASAGVVPASLSITQLVLSEARPGILPPLVDEAGARSDREKAEEDGGARPARAALSRTQLSLAEARPGFSLARRRVDGAKYRIGGAGEEDGGTRQQIDGGVGSSGGAAAAEAAITGRTGKGSLAESKMQETLDLGNRKREQGRGWITNSMESRSRCAAKFPPKELARRLLGNFRGGREAGGRPCTYEIR